MVSRVSRQRTGYNEFLWQPGPDKGDEIDRLLAGFVPGVQQQC